jgi:hypothetical protein
MWNGSTVVQRQHLHERTIVWADIPAQDESTRLGVGMYGVVIA